MPCRAKAPRQDRHGRRARDAEAKRRQEARRPSLALLALSGAMTPRMLPCPKAGPSPRLRVGTAIGEPFGSPSPRCPARPPETSPAHSKRNTRRQCRKASSTPGSSARPALAGCCRAAPGPGPGRGTAVQTAREAQELRSPWERRPRNRILAERPASAPARDPARPSDTRMPSQRRPRSPRSALPPDRSATSVRAEHR